MGGSERGKGACKQNVYLVGRLREKHFPARDELGNGYVGDALRLTVLGKGEYPRGHGHQRSRPQLTHKLNHQVVRGAAAHGREARARPRDCRVEDVHSSPEARCKHIQNHVAGPDSLCHEPLA